MYKLISIIFTLILALPQGAVHAEGVTVRPASGDRIAVFEDISVENRTDGSVIALFGNADINADVSGDVVAVFGDVSVNSNVGGQVVSAFGKLTLKGAAAVNGDVVSVGSYARAQGASVKGQEIEITAGNIDFGPQFFIYARTAATAVFAIIVLAVGTILIAVSGDKLKFRYEHVHYAIGRKFAIGLLALLGTTILALLLIVTVIAPLIYLAVLIMCSVAASIFIGRLVLKASYPDNSLFLEFFTGFVILALAKAVLIFSLPPEQIVINLLLSLVFWLAVNSIGFGALVESRYGRRI